MRLPSPNAFRGEAPRVDEDKLPEGYSQIAQNTRLFSGSLEAFQAMLSEGAFAKGDPIRSIYPMDLLGQAGGPFWLHWRDNELGVGQAKVDVARGAIPGDTTERSYITGLDVPRVTTLALATTGGSGGGFPYNTFKLGVPAPAAEPLLVLSGSAASSNAIALTNPGAESNPASTGWTVTLGDLNRKDNDDVPGLPPKVGSFFFFGGVGQAVTEAFQSKTFATETILPGQSLVVKWWQARGDNASMAAMGLRFLDAASAIVGETFADMIATQPNKTWVERTVTGVVPATADKVRVVMRFERVGGGENDAFIDDIRLSKEGNQQLSYDGSSLSDFLIAKSSANANVSISTVDGFPAPSFRFDSRSANVATMYRDVDFNRSSQVTVECEFQSFGGSENQVVLDVILGADAVGKGQSLSLWFDEVHRRSHVTWSTLGAKLGADLETVNINPETRKKFRLVCGKSSPSQYTVAWSISRSDGVLLDAGSTTIDVFGEYIGFKGHNPDGDPADARLDNIVITSSAPASSAAEAESRLTSYVETYVNGFGEESAPSLPSRSVQVGDGISVQITSATAPPTDYNITLKRRYRAAQGSDGAVYRLVEQIPVGTATTTDTKTDDQLGAVLEPDADWVLPPSNGRCIRAMANGITSMIAGNMWCPSVINRPHTYPLGFRLTTDYPIVAQEIIDTDAVLATQTHAYVVTGSDPAQMAMSKPEPGGCVSERSMVSLRGFGVVYAGQDGLIAASRSGVVNITERLGLLSEKEWKALKPESIAAFAHDGRYYGFYFIDAGNKGGFIFDPEERGFGWVRLDFHATAGYSNLANNRLYLSIGAARTLWNGDAVLKLPYRYRSPKFRIPYPASLEFAQIRADSYASLNFKLYYDGALVMDRAVMGAMEFLLPAVAANDYIEWELSGTDSVKSIVLADDASEILA